ncbi:cytochrome P450 [Amycolatopsis aidingensis]|uniref:cytochrome P450 n=1 Tax=Amycolatopsis aidingensis TaxID=2842453 RepID=UPI001C0DA3AB|nr:cytochrome P450 [Amycolatopsis aidingensis]
MTVSQHGMLMASDLPFELRMCPHLRPVPEGSPARRVRTPAGDEAWLVTGHAEVRELLLDPRLGRSHPAPDSRAQYAGHPTYDQVTSADHQAADEMHAGLRAVMKPYFTTRRMLELQPRVEEFVAERTRRLIATGRPADLRETFSAPLLRQVFNELLGVPAADRERCAELMRLAAEGDLPGFLGYLGELVARRDEAAEDGMIAGLSAAGLPDEQVVQVSLLVQLAGFGATLKQIDYGILLLAHNPEQRAAVTGGPELRTRAVEEILRLSGSLSLPRYAREDIRLGEVTIGANELVLLDLTVANFDEQAFADPRGFDVERSPNRHLTFSHGAWTCLGAPLARLILRTTFAGLFGTLPGLTPATPLVAADEPGAPLSGGLPEQLLVTW